MMHIGEMFLWSTGPVFCGSDNFAGTLVDISFMIIAQEGLARMLIRICKIFNCNFKASFLILLSMWLVITENKI